MKKIAFVICTMVGGGAQRVIVILSQYLATRGYSVSIIATSDDKNDYVIDDAVRYIALDNSNSGHFPIKQISRFTKLYRELKTQNYDYVAAFLPTTCVYAALCRSLGCRFQFIAAERMDPRQSNGRYLLTRLRDWSYKAADKVVFQTEDAKNTFNESIRNKSAILANPINGELPEPYQGEREKRVVTAIRLDSQKNPKMLICAFEKFHLKHSEFKLEIYGKGEMYDELSAMIQEKGLSDCVFLKGFQSNIYEHIRTAYFFALSSDYEGVSNSMLEALCLGLPIVSTDHPIGGAKMYIKDGINGYLTPVGDADKFAEAMDRIVRLSKEDYKAMSDSAAGTRKELSPEFVCQEWEKFITA